MNSSRGESLKSPCPRHIGIIMDGNGRWASERGWPRVFGHREGVKRVREIVTSAVDLKIEVLTLYAFSVENWTRPSREIDFLMSLLKTYLRRELSTMISNEIRFQVIGSWNRLPEGQRKLIEEVRLKTESNQGMILQLALSYGGRDEILRAVQKIATSVESGHLKSAEITEETFARFLDTRSLPDPDLIIRTGGEQRLSNFLLWQAAYAEFYFVPTLWPDFNKAEFQKAIDYYRGRERRFGGVLDGVLARRS